MNIDLDNNYVLDLLHQNSSEVINIQRIKWKDIKKQRC